MASELTRFREQWLELSDGQSMCALIHGSVGFLMYLPNNGDAGFTSRNPDYGGPQGAQIEYELSNGQRDFYPASWALPIDVLQTAFAYFEREKKPPSLITWHDDGSDHPGAIA